MIINALYGKNQAPQLEVVHILYQGNAPAVLQPSVIVDSSMTGTLSQVPSPLHYHTQDSMRRDDFGQYVSKLADNQPQQQYIHAQVPTDNIMGLPLLQLDEEDPLNIQKFQTLCANTGATGTGSPTSNPELYVEHKNGDHIEPPTPKVGHFQNTALIQGLKGQYQTVKQDTKISSRRNKLLEDDEFDKSSGSNTGTAILLPNRVAGGRAHDDNFATIADGMNKNKDLKQSPTRPSNIEEENAARIAYSLSRSRELSQSRDCQRSERRCASREHKARISNIIKDQVVTGGSEGELISEASPRGQLTPTAPEKKRVTEEILVDSLKMGNKSFLPNFKPPNNNAVKSSLYQHSKNSQSRISPNVVSNSGKVRKTNETPCDTKLNTQLKSVVTPKQNHTNTDLKTIQVIHSSSNSKKNVENQKSAPIDFDSEVNRNLQTRSMSSSHAEGFQTMAIKELKLQGGFGDQNEYRVSSARPDSSGLNHTYSASLKQRYKNIIGNESESITATEQKQLALTTKGIMQSAAIHGSQIPSPRLGGESRTGVRETEQNTNKKPQDTDTICQVSQRERTSALKEHTHNETTILAHSANSQKANSMNEEQFFRDDEDVPEDDPKETHMNFNIKVDATNLFQPINESRSSKFKYQPRSRERGAQRICNKGLSGKNSPSGGGSNGPTTHRRQNPNQAKYPMKQATIEQLSVHGKKAPPKETKTSQRKKMNKPAYIPREERKWKRILQIGDTPWTPAQETQSKPQNIKIGDGTFNSSPLSKESPESVNGKKDVLNITGGGAEVSNQINKDLPKSRVAYNQTDQDKDKKSFKVSSSTKKRTKEQFLQKESFLQGTSFEPGPRQNATPAPNTHSEVEKKKREFASATSLVVQMKKMDVSRLQMETDASQPSSQLGTSPRSPCNLYLESAEVTKSANKSVNLAVQSSSQGEQPGTLKIVKRKGLAPKRKNSIDVFSTCAQKNFLLPEEGKIKVRELSIQNIENVSADRGPNSKSMDSLEESNVLKPIGKQSGPVIRTSAAHDDKLHSGKQTVQDTGGANTSLVASTTKKEGGDLLDTQKSLNNKALLKVGKPVVSKHNSKLIIIGDCLQPTIKQQPAGDNVKRIGRPTSQQHLQQVKSGQKRSTQKQSVAIDTNTNPGNNEVVITLEATKSLEEPENNRSATPIDQETIGQDQQTQYLPKDTGDIGRYYHGDSRLVEDFQLLNKSPTDAKSQQNNHVPLNLNNSRPGPEKYDNLRDMYNQTADVNSAAHIQASDTSTHPIAESQGAPKHMRTTITQKSSVIGETKGSGSFPPEQIEISSAGSSSSQLQMEQKMLIDSTDQPRQTTKQPIKVQRIKTTHVYNNERSLREKESDGPNEKIPDGQTNSALEETESPAIHHLLPRNNVDDAKNVWIRRLGKKEQSEDGADDDRSSPTNFNITTEEVKQEFLAMQTFGRNRGVEQEPSVDAPDRIMRRRSTGRKPVVVSASPQKKHSQSPQRVFHPLQTIQLQMAEDMHVKSIRSRSRPNSKDSGVSPPDTTGGIDETDNTNRDFLKSNVNSDQETPMNSVLKKTVSPPKSKFEKMQRAQRVIFNSIDGSKQVIVPRMTSSSKENLASYITKERRKGGDEVLPVALVEVPRGLDKMEMMVYKANEQRNRQNTSGMGITGTAIFTMRQKQIIAYEQMRLEQEYEKEREEQNKRALEQLEKMNAQSNQVVQNNQRQLRQEMYSTGAMNFKYAMQGYGADNGSRMFLISKGQFLDQPPAMRPPTREGRTLEQTDQSVCETDSSHESAVQGVEMGTDNPGWLPPEDYGAPLGASPADLETDRLESNYGKSARGDFNLGSVQTARERESGTDVKLPGPIREVIMQQQYSNNSGSQMSSQTAAFHSGDNNIKFQSYIDPNKDAETVYMAGLSEPYQGSKKSRVSPTGSPEQNMKWPRAVNQKEGFYSKSFKLSPNASNHQQRGNEGLVSDFKQNGAPPLDLSLDLMEKSPTQAPADSQERSHLGPIKSKRESCHVLSNSRRDALHTNERNPSGMIDRHVRKKVPLSNMNLNNNQSSVKNQTLFAAVLCDSDSTTGNILLQQQKLMSSEAGGLVMVDVDHLELPERGRASPTTKSHDKRKKHADKERTKVNSINTSVLSDATSQAPNQKEATVMINYNNFEQNSTGSLEKIQSPVANITINKAIRPNANFRHNASRNAQAINTTVPELKLDQAPMWDSYAQHVHFAQTTFAQHNVRRQRPHTQENGRGRQNNRQRLAAKNENFNTLQDSTISKALSKASRRTPDKKKIGGKTLFQKVSQQMSDAFASHDLQKSNHKSVGVHVPITLGSSIVTRKQFKSSIDQRGSSQLRTSTERPPHKPMSNAVTAAIQSKAQHFVPRRTIFSNTSMHFNPHVGASNDNRDLQDVVQSDFQSEQDRIHEINSENLVLKDSQSEQQSPSGRQFNPRLTADVDPGLYITVDEGYQPPMQTLAPHTTTSGLGDSLDRIHTNFHQNNKPMSAGLNPRIHKRQRTIRELLDGQTGKPTGAGGGLDFVDAGRLRTCWITAPDGTTQGSSEHFKTQQFGYSPSTTGGAVSKINILNAQNSILPHALKAKLDNIVRSSSFASSSRHPESILLMHQKRNDMVARLNLCNTASRIGTAGSQARHGQQKFNTLGSVFLSTDKDNGQQLTRQMTLEKYQGTLSPQTEAQALNTKSQPPRAWILQRGGQGKTTKKGQLRKIAGGRLLPTGRPKNAPLISC